MALLTARTLLIADPVITSIIGIVRHKTQTVRVSNCSLNINNISTILPVVRHKTQIIRTVTNLLSFVTPSNQAATPSMYWS